MFKLINITKYTNNATDFLCQEILKSFKTNIISAFRNIKFLLTDMLFNNSVNNEEQKITSAITQISNHIYVGKQLTHEFSSDLFAAEWIDFSDKYSLYLK